MTDEQLRQMGLAVNATSKEISACAREALDRIFKDKTLTHTAKLGTQMKVCQEMAAAAFGSALMLTKVIEKVSGPQIQLATATAFCEGFNQQLTAICESHAPNLNVRLRVVLKDEPGDES